MPILIDEVSATLSYIGISSDNSLQTDKVWEILKLDTSAGLTLQSVIDAKDKKGAIWTNRATYTYG